MIELPVDGRDGARVFRHRDRVRLADVSPADRARLDALARWLQDAAHEDVVDAAIEDDGVWIVRRLEVRIHRFPRLREPVEVATFCTGIAPLWAERTSVVESAGERLAEATALWVHLQADGARPQPLPPAFARIYGPTAGDRRVRARLRHPAAPPVDAPARPWRFRTADLDLAGHVNNAVYWAALEEELAALPPDTPMRAEIEHRAPTAAGDLTVRADGPQRWLVDPDGIVVATLRAEAGPP